MYDLVIIGAGPAGLTAALYAGRFRMNTIILEKMSPGGQIILSPSIENYPGFPGGISTHELIEKFKSQVQELGVKIVPEEVVEIASEHASQETVYKLKTSDNVYQARAVIIATGAQPKQLGAEGEKQLTGRGVSYCGTCDGPFFRNKDVVVVGAGDRAFEDALFLCEYASSVTLIHRRQGFRASKILEEKAKANPKIKFVLDSVVEKITGENKVESVMAKNVKTGRLSEIKCAGVFVFVGIKPNTDFIKNYLQLDESGFIITQQNTQASRPGIFACGDCCSKSLYQVINACGEAAVASDSAHKYLLNQERK
ncbi:MAG: thioredoxin-disulfide reductase [Candidatus Omnitrophota bacterium]|jgi:thioredoxin reductase (NADPH)|nr:MAG: thioredoxin-disulfide reductase [Candidatus Omnitrophota bacterium]